VYCIFHNSHNRNLQRELLYTAITRAQKELYVICEPETFVQGVLSQHIIGNTLAEKAEYFKGKKIEMTKGIISSIVITEVPSERINSFELDEMGCFVSLPKEVKFAKE